MKFLALLIALITPASVLAEDHCPYVAQTKKIRESDLVADGRLDCSRSVDVCFLRTRRVIKARRLDRPKRQEVAVRVLRREADAYRRQLEEEGAISFCYPAKLWWPLSDIYTGRFYLKQDGANFLMAFHPRLRERA